SPSATPAGPADVAVNGGRQRCAPDADRPPDGRRASMGLRPDIFWGNPLIPGSREWHDMASHRFRPRGRCQRPPLPCAPRGGVIDVMERKELIIRRAPLVVIAAGGRS